MSGKHESVVFDFSGEDDYLAWMPVASPDGDTTSAAGADVEHPGRRESLTARRHICFTHTYFNLIYYYALVHTI